jgi:hypothetical protein
VLTSPNGTSVSLLPAGLSVVQPTTPAVSKGYYASYGFDK